MAEGYTTHEIAKHLGSSAETIKTHRKKIIMKAGARNMFHALAIYWERG